MFIQLPEQLLQMNYEQSDLRKTNFEIKDVRDLVNRIMCGDLPAFKFASFELFSPNIDQIVSGINYDKIPSQLQNNQISTKYGRHKYYFYGVYDYERADGKVVSICDGRTTPKVTVFVWSRTEPVDQFK